MSSVNGVGSDQDPLSNDSMDPNDPNSIMYDPAYAEKNGSVTVGPNGQIIVVPPVGGKDPYADADDLPTISNVQDLQKSGDNVSKKLRRFGKL